MSHESQPLACMLGEGEVRTLLRAHDWAGFSIGHPASWPHELVFLLGLMLDAPVPTFILWGRELEILYNDGYAGMLGTKHPALGRPFKEVWGEGWDSMQPVLDSVMRGQSVHIEDSPHTVQRNGSTEQAWFNCSYSPVRLGDGTIGGVYCTLFDTTDKVLAIRTQAFQIGLAERVRTLSTAADIIAFACQLLGEHLGMDRVWYAEVDDRARTFVTKNMWTSHPLPALPSAGSIDAYGTALVDPLLRGEPFAVGCVKGSSQKTENKAR